MQTKNNLIVIILSVVTVGSLVFALASFQRVKRGESELSEKKAVLVKENLDLKDRVTAIQDMLDKKTATLDGFESEKQKLQYQVEYLKKENNKIMDSFAQRMNAANKKKEVLKKRIATLEKGSIITSLKNALAREQNVSIKKIIENALNNIELASAGKPVTLQSITITKSSQSQAVATSDTQQDVPTDDSEIKGAILSLDKKNNLMVIDLGRKDNVQTGYRCKILKDGKEIAQAEIISLRYRIAAAFIDDITYKYTIDDIKEGYEVLVEEA